MQETWGYWSDLDQVSIHEQYVLSGVPANAIPTDVCYGYITADAAGPLKIETAFSKDEELLVQSRNLNISTAVNFPFFTVQNKSSFANSNMSAAERQILRDGPAVVRSNNLLFTYAGFSTEKFAETCHFSAATDLESARLYIHWTEHDLTSPNFPIYQTQLLHECRLRLPKEVADWRRWIRGIHQWAISGRVALFQQAVARLAENPDAIFEAGQRGCESSTAPSSVSGMTLGRAGDVSTPLRGPDRGRWMDDLPSLPPPVQSYTASASCASSTALAQQPLEEDELGDADSNQMQSRKRRK